MGRRGSHVAFHPLCLVFLGVIENACHVPRRELFATIKECCSRETALASVWEGYEDESWEESN
jgi:hypothetical protein